MPHNILAQGDRTWLTLFYCLHFGERHRLWGWWITYSLSASCERGSESDLYLLRSV